MRDIVWTIIIVWLIYKIISVFRNSRTIVFNKHEHHYNSGNIKVDQTQKTKSDSKKDDDGEYVDFEEIK